MSHVTILLYCYFFVDVINLIVISEIVIYRWDTQLTHCKQDEKNTKLASLSFFLYKQNANQIDRKLSEINDAQICNSNWFFRARFFSASAVAAALRSYVSLLLRFAFWSFHFMFSSFRFALFACPLLLFHSHLGVTHTQTHTPSTHTQYTLLFSHGLFCSSQSLSLSTSFTLWLLASCFPSSSFGLGVFGSNCVPRSFQPLLCVYCVLLSFSSIKAKYMVLFKHVAQCVCELVCIYLERFHHVLSYAHILIKRKIIAHKKCKW